MNKIYQEINARAAGKYADVRFSEVAFKNDRAEVCVTCLHGAEQVLRADEELKRLITELCPFNTPLTINITAEDLSPRKLRDAVAAFTRKIPFVASVADDIRAHDEPPTVKFIMYENMLELAKNDFFPRLEEFLKNMYVTPVKVEVESVALAHEEADASAAHETKIYAVSDIVPLYGSIDATTAMSAADVSGNNEGISVCGILTMATDFLSKGAGAKRSRPYEKFILYDGDTTLQCRMFPHDGFSVVDADILNKPVCVFGNTELERGRTNECAMTVRSLALCNAKGLTALQLKPEPEDYETVRPLAYEEYIQASLFGEADVLPPALVGTFVAFDFETTGLSILYDKPTELGAVKIVDGVITETFSTLIDPKRPIPEEVSKKTGITDDMVKGQPLFEDVIPDFYKFTRGAALIGHNIAFDFPFLLKYGNRAGYAFGDRKTFDTLGIAPRAIPGIDVLTLDHVLSELGLVNDNAHRALSDATATAKAFIAMQKRLYKNQA